MTSNELFKLYWLILGKFKCAKVITFYKNIVLNVALEISNYRILGIYNTIKASENLLEIIY